MYKILVLLSLFIRNFVLPNPFEVLGEGLLINGVLLSPILLNWIAEPFLHIITFSIVGLFYRRNSEPVLGSILYLIFYIVNITVLGVMCYFGFRWWSNLIVLIIYVLLVRKIGESISY